MNAIKVVVVGVVVLVVATSAAIVRFTYASKFVNV